MTWAVLCRAAVGSTQGKQAGCPCPWRLLPPSLCPTSCSGPGSAWDGGCAAQGCLSSPSQDPTEPGTPLIPGRGYKDLPPAEWHRPFLSLRERHFGAGGGGLPAASTSVPTGLFQELPLLLRTPESL